MVLDLSNINTEPQSHHSETSFIFGPSAAVPVGGQVGPYGGNAAITSGSAFGPQGGYGVPGGYGTAQGAFGNQGAYGSTSGFQGQPQSNSWLFKNWTAPSFAPPAPAEAAAAWSNHAALASQKAESALRDIQNLRQSAIQELNGLRSASDTSRAEIQQETDKILSDLQLSSSDAIKTYGVSKAAVKEMVRPIIFPICKVFLA